MPITTVYALVVWLLSGVLTNHWWWQFACFAITCYLMVELNNINALIRIFSRMVSSAFLVLTCCACFLFPALHEAVMQTCLTAFVTMLFLTYQNKGAAGITYYAFLLFGVASVAYVHILFLIIDHFTALTDFEEPFNLYGITGYQKATLGLIILMAVISTIHFIRKNYLDKIRTRMFYGFFIWMDLAALVFLLLQPQHFNAMLLIMILSTSPLIAHFVALTSTKLTNITFLVLSTATLLLTAYNLWIS